MPPETGEVQGPPTRAQAAAQQRAADNEAHDAYQGDTPTPKVHYRIDTSDFAFLLLFAGLFDLFGLLGFIPGVGAIIDIIAQFIIGFIFVINGVSLLERRFLVRYVFFAVIEFIPFLGMLPLLMAEAYSLAALSWIADKALATSTKAASKAVGKRFAGAMVGLAYGRMITGQTPVPASFDRRQLAWARNDTKPLEKGWKGLTSGIKNFGKNVAAMKDATKFPAAAMKKGAITEFPKTFPSQIPPSKRGGGASYVDGIRVPSQALQLAEIAPPAPTTPSHIVPASQSAVLPGSLDGVRPDVREPIPASQADRAPEQAQKTSAGRSTESEKPTGMETPATPYAATPKKPEEIAESEKSPETKAQAPSNVSFDTRAGTVAEKQKERPAVSPPSPQSIDGVRPEKSTTPQTEKVGFYQPPLPREEKEKKDAGLKPEAKAPEMHGEARQTYSASGYSAPEIPISQKQASTILAFPEKPGARSENTVPQASVRNDAFIAHPFSEISSSAPVGARPFAFELDEARSGKPLSVSALRRGSDEPTPATIAERSEWGVLLKSGNLDTLAPQSAPETRARTQETTSAASDMAETGVVLSSPVGENQMVAENPQIAGVYARLPARAVIARDTAAGTATAEVPDSQWWQNMEEASKRGLPLYIMERKNIVRRVVRINLETKVVTYSLEESLPEGVITYSETTKENRSEEFKKAA